MSRGSRVNAVRVCLALLIVAAPALGQESILVTETSLRPAPAARDISALLTVGTSVEVLDRQGDWVRVRLEGWVRASSVAGRTAAPVSPPAVPVRPPTAADLPKPTPPTSVVAPVGALPAAGVEGLIRVKLGRRKTLSAAGIPVLLLSSTALQDEALDRPETAARIAELDAEAARLEREADKAMRLPTFSEATALHDKLMGQRKDVLSEKRDLLAVEHGRREQAARAAALFTSVADARGWFSLPSVPPGRYTLYVRMVSEQADLEWVEPLTVGDGPLRIDLDTSNAHGMLPD